MRLIDADKLIGDLHHHAFLEGDDRAIAYNVIQQQPTIGGWISVKDRLPERKFPHSQPKFPKNRQGCKLTGRKGSTLHG